MNLTDLMCLSDEAFLKQAYLSLLDRAIDTVGMVTHLKQLISGYPRVSILRDVYYSEEAKRSRNLADLQGLSDEDYIDAVYQRLLGRSPDPTGWQHYLAKIQTGKRKDIIGEIKRSEEYKDRHKSQITLKNALLNLFNAQDAQSFAPSRSHDDTAIPQPHTYQAWIHQYESLAAQDINDIFSKLPYSDKSAVISIVLPISGADLEHLDACIHSVKHQIYSHWELLLVEGATATEEALRKKVDEHATGDARITVVSADTATDSLQVSLNEGLKQAVGRIVLCLNPADQLPEMALWHIAQAVTDAPDAKLFYGDEDQLDEVGQRSAPYFKPDFDYYLHLAQNLTGGACVFDTEMLRSMGGFRALPEDLLFWDASLRILEQVPGSQIIHIPRILLHRRQCTEAPAIGARNGAAQEIVAEHLARRKIAAQVFAAPDLPSCNRVIFGRVEPQPKVSIIIPTRDRADLLKQCVTSIREKSTYSNYEILIVDNGSTDAATLSLLQQLGQQNVRVERLDIPFNYSTLNNFAAEKAEGEYLCFLNNDTEVLTSDWLEEMVSFAMQEHVGIVGARLWYPDGRLQHAGVITGRHGNADHIHKGLTRGETGYFGRAVLHQRFSAVTGACILLRRSIFEQASGFDEAFPVSLGDIDLCLRVQELGYANIWTPYAELLHHESASRGLDAAIHQSPRLAMETATYHARWGGKLFLDPAYNPNLSLDAEEFSPAFPPRQGRMGQLSHSTLDLLAREQFPTLKEVGTLAAQAFMQENARLRRAAVRSERLAAQLQLDILTSIQVGASARKENEETVQHLLALQEEMVALIEAHKEDEARIAGLELDKSQLHEEKAGLLREQEVARMEQAVLQQERDSLAELAIQREAELTTLQQERDEQARLVSQRQEEVDALQQTKTDLEAENEETVQHLLALQEEMERRVLEGNEKGAIVNSGV
ncbi:MAG: glycosyltransferase [Acidithiobacillaceae bacterium]|nr:glycosyltransferase [Acidithiobacillaceae bacterium]